MLVVLCCVVFCCVLLCCVVFRGHSVVWCGVVWCDVVWCGVMWCGVMWCDVMYGVVWCGVVRWGEMQGGVIPHTLLFLMWFYRVVMCFLALAYFISPSLPSSLIFQMSKCMHTSPPLPLPPAWVVDDRECAVVASLSSNVCVRCTALTFSSLLKAQVSNALLTWAGSSVVPRAPSREF